MIYPDSCNDAWQEYNNLELSIVSSISDSLIRLKEAGYNTDRIILCTGNKHLNDAAQPIADDIVNHHKAVDKLSDQS